MRVEHRENAKGDEDEEQQQRDDVKHLEVLVLLPAARQRRDDAVQRRDGDEPAQHERGDEELVRRQGRDGTAVVVEAPQAEVHAQAHRGQLQNRHHDLVSELQA